MIRFIYAPSRSSGRAEEYIRSGLAADAAAGTRAFLIVPEQMTVSAERRLLEQLPPSAQLTVEVLNFSRLANRIFRERGGLAYNYASKGLRRLMMWRALQELAPTLSEYGTRAKDDPTLPDVMLSAVREFKVSGVTPDRIDSVVNRLPDSPVRRKLRDLALVSSFYTALLGGKYADADDDLTKLAELLETDPFFTGMNVYLNGFSSLTGQEHRLTRLIMAQARNTVICLPLDSPTGRGIDYVSVRTCSDRLRNDAASLDTETQTVTFDDPPAPGEAGVIESLLWRLDAPIPAPLPENERGHVELKSAADIYDEAESAAARIRELLENGARCRDIVVVARDATRYLGILDQALENDDIPYYFSEKADLSSSPLSRLVLSALRIFIFGWKREDVIAHLKTGLCAIPPRDADLFECYTYTWRIRGRNFTDPAEWTMDPGGYRSGSSDDPRAREILETANRVKRQLTEPLLRLSEDLSSAADCPDMCRAVLRYLEEKEVPDALVRLAARELSDGKKREAAQTAGTYDAFTEALDCVCDAFDGVRPDMKTFASALRTALESLQIGTIPTSSDEVVVGSADMLRTDSPRFALLLGVCEGEFPGTAGNGGLFSDTERALLTAQDLALSGDRESRASDELMYFRRAACAPSELLTVYTRSDSVPSSAFNRLRALFPYLKVTDTSTETMRMIRTPRAAAEYMLLLRDRPEGRALQRVMSSDPVWAEMIPPDPSLLPIQACADVIDPDTAVKAYGKRLHMSQSRAEKYVNCPFSFVCGYLLRLNEGKRAAFSFDSAGTFIHTILEKYLRYVFLDNGGRLPDDDERKRLLDDIISGLIARMFPGGAAERTARLDHLTRRLRKNSEIMLDDILLELSDSDFIPRFFEFSVGPGGDVPGFSLTLDNGTEVRFNGKIDRVDLYESGGKIFIRVVDYKSGTKKFALEDIRDGVDLQLLLYLYALTSARDGEFARRIGGEPTAAAVTYVSRDPAVSKQPDRLYTPDETADLARASVRRFGLVLNDAEVLNAVSRSSEKKYLMGDVSSPSRVSAEEFNGIFEEVKNILSRICTEMTGGHAEALPKIRSNSSPCNYCPYVSVCRSARKTTEY